MFWIRFGSSLAMVASVVLAVMLGSRFVGAQPLSHHP